MVNSVHTKENHGKRKETGKPCSVEVIFFDFGGVVAEEGYRGGLLSIARLNGLDENQFLKRAVELTFNRGFVTGHMDEKSFWQLLRQETGIKGSDATFRSAVLSSFTFRPWMLEWVKKLKSLSVRTAMLSDQTNWLDELNDQYGFFLWFDRIFNSYYLGKSKRDASIFDDVRWKFGDFLFQTYLMYIHSIIDISPTYSVDF